MFPPQSGRLVPGRGSGEKAGIIDREDFNECRQVVCCNPANAPLPVAVLVGIDANSALSKLGGYFSLSKLC